MADTLTPTRTEVPTIPERAALPPAGAFQYAIVGRPGRIPTLEAAYAEAEALVRRLRLASRVQVKIAGTDTIVGYVVADDAGIVIVHLQGGPA